MSVRRCKAKTKAGKACKANPMKDTDFCLSHTPQEARGSVSFGGPQPGSGRPKTPRVTDVYAEELHKRVAEHLDELLGRLIAIALDAERTVVVGTGPNARTEIAPDQGLQLAALRELNDRILGRPKQSTEISGPDGGPIETAPIAIPDTEAYRSRVAELASAALGISVVTPPAATNGHGGNGNGRNGHG